MPSQGTQWEYLLDPDLNRSAANLGDKHRHEWPQVCVIRAKAEMQNNCPMEEGVVRAAQCGRGSSQGREGIPGEKNFSIALQDKQKVTTPGVLFSGCLLLQDSQPKRHGIFHQEGCQFNFSMKVYTHGYTHICPPQSCQIDSNYFWVLSSNFKGIKSKGTSCLWFQALWGKIWGW